MVDSIKDRLPRYKDLERSNNPIRFREKYYNTIWSKSNYGTFTCHYLCRIINRLLYDDKLKAYKISHKEIMEDDFKEISLNEPIFRIIKNYSGSIFSPNCSIFSVARSSIKSTIKHKSI